MKLVGIRGATMLQKNDAVEMKAAVTELLKESLDKNNVKNEDLVSIIFTTTEDLNCAFPAASAREATLQADHAGGHRADGGQRDRQSVARRPAGHHCDERRAGAAQPQSLGPVGADGGRCRSVDAVRGRRWPAHVVMAKCRSDRSVR